MSDFNAPSRDPLSPLSPVISPIGTYPLDPQLGSLGGTAISTEPSVQWERNTPVAAEAQAVDKDDVIDVLNDVLESCRDGEYGFRTSSEHTEAADLKRIFLHHSNDCATAAAELVIEINALGGEPVTGGTLTGALHRGWVSVKTALTSQDDKAVLQECERGEDAAVARYRKALQNPLPANVRAMLERQAQGAQRNHDEVRALRDRFEATART